MRRPQPTDPQREVLQRFADRHGRKWRTQLRSLWERDPPASYPDGALLRQVRNELGPEWLGSYSCKIKPTKEGLCHPTPT